MADKLQCRCSRAEAACMTDKREKGPPGCPGRTRFDIIQRCADMYADPELRRVARNAALVEAEGYMRWTRVDEIVEFARKMGFRRLGVACCIGLINETRTLIRILETKGFEVVALCCKGGGIPKEVIDIKDEEKIKPGGHESMCNPIAQAEILNQEGCEFNIVMGLCVGHDSMFFRYSKPLTTVLVVKDRVLCHNTVAAIYNSNAYYRRLQSPD